MPRVDMGQIHFNRVDDMWCAYYCPPSRVESNDFMLASIHISVVDDSAEIKQRFVKLVQQMVMSLFEKTDERFSPEHVEWATEQMPTDEKLN